MKPADDLYQLGLAFYRAGNFRRCVECADQALAANPDDAPCLVLRGMALIELDRPDEAAGVLRRAVGLMPDSENGWRHLGIALMTVGDLGGAAEAFRAVLCLRPEGLPVMIDLANILFMLGQVDEGVGLLERASRLNRGDLSILRNLAGMYISAGRPGPALETLRQILELQPEDVLACCDAAWLHLGLGRHEEAAAMFRTLRRVDTEPEREHELYALHGLAMTEIHRGNWRGALDLAIEATRLDRYEQTTMMLQFLNGKLFGTAGVTVTQADLDARFEAEHAEHRRWHAEARPSAGVAGSPTAASR